MNEEKVAFWPLKSTFRPNYAQNCKILPPTPSIFSWDRRYPENLASGAARAPEYHYNLLIRILTRSWVVPIERKAVPFWVKPVVELTEAHSIHDLEVWFVKKEKSHGIKIKEPCLVLLAKTFVSPVFVPRLVCGWPELSIRGSETRLAWRLENELTYR